MHISYTKYRIREETDTELSMRHKAKVMKNNMHLNRNQWRTVQLTFFYTLML